MTPRRAAAAVLAIVLGVLLALGAWSADQPSGSLSDDDYIAIALSQPQVFHPSGATSGQQVRATGIERGGGVVTVHVTSDGQRSRVEIDARTNAVTRVVRE